MKAVDKSEEQSDPKALRGLTNFDNIFWPRGVWEMEGYSGYWVGERLITDIAFA